MVTLDKLKSYLRIDDDYEDELLQEFLTTAKAYLTGAVSGYSENYATYPEFASKADLLQMVLAAELYQNRDNSSHDMSYTVRSLMAQLQYFAGGVETNSDTSATDTALTFAMFDSNGNLVNSGIKIASEEDIENLLDDTGFTGGGDNAG